MKNIETLFSTLLVGLVISIVFVIGPNKSRKKNHSTQHPIPLSYPISKETEIGESEFDGKSGDLQLQAQVYQMMDEKGATPSYFMQNSPLLFLQSGTLLHDSMIHALVAYELSDSSFLIELWDFQQDSSWRKISIALIPDLSYQLEFKFKDYNFDGMRDIFIHTEENLSNNHLMHQGYLCTIDSFSQQLLLHPKTLELSNLSIDEDRSRLVSEQVTAFENGMQEVCIREHRWVEEKLLTTYIRCPSDFQ